MKIAYLDCFSGLSGDMVLGALLDIGVDSDSLRAELAKLPLTEYVMAAKPVTRGRIGATKVSIKATEKGLVRTYHNVRRVLEESGLETQVKERSLAIFQTLAQAQAKVNRKNVETIHFHEVGAVDSIVDIVGAAIGFHILGVDRVYCSPLPMGLGMTRTEHGMMPIPSPVTLEILTGVPVYSTGLHAELVTPTGAAIARSYVQKFSEMPPMIVTNTGYGAGRADLEASGVLRMVTGESTETATDNPATLIVAIIDRTDDAAGAEILEKLLAAGADDAWLTPVGKVGGAEALELTVLSSPNNEESLIAAIFALTAVDDLLVARQPRRRSR